MYKIDKEYSERINVLRLILIVLVAIAHNYSQTANFTGSVVEVDAAPWINMIKYIFTYTLARSTAPLFFVISGILLYSKEFDALVNIKKKTRSILVPYIFWNTAWILVFFVFQSMPLTRDFFPASGNTVRDFGLWQWIDAYAGISRGGRPFLYPFWFLRDLFVLNLLAVPIKKLSDRFPVFMLAGGLALWLSGINDFGQSLLFFVLGYFIVKHGIDVTRADKFSLRDVGAAYALTIVLFCAFRYMIPALYHVCILIGMLFFIMLSLKIVRNETARRICLSLSPYVFMILACHEFTVSFLRKLALKVIPQTDAVILLEFFCIPAIAITACVLLGMILKRLLPGFYRIVAGNR